MQKGFSIFLMDIIYPEISQYLQEMIHETHHNNSMPKSTIRATCPKNRPWQASKSST